MVLSLEPTSRLKKDSETIARSLRWRSEADVPKELECLTMSFETWHGVHGRYPRPAIPITASKDFVASSAHNGTFPDCDIPLSFFDLITATFRTSFALTYPAAVDTKRLVLLGDIHHHVENHSQWRAPKRPATPRLLSQREEEKFPRDC
jgi:hypothetical protein